MQITRLQSLLLSRYASERRENALQPETLCSLRCEFPALALLWSQARICNPRVLGALLKERPDLAGRLCQALLNAAWGKGRGRGARAALIFADACNLSMLCRKESGWCVLLALARAEGRPWLERARVPGEAEALRVNTAAARRLVPEALREILHLLKTGDEGFGFSQDLPRVLCDALQDLRVRRMAAGDHRRFMIAETCARADAFLAALSGRPCRQALAGLPVHSLRPPALF